MNTFLHILRDKNNGIGFRRKELCSEYNEKQYTIKYGYIQRANGYY